MSLTAAVSLTYLIRCVLLLSDSCMGFEKPEIAAEHDPEMERRAEEAAQIARDAGWKVMNYFTDDVVRRLPSLPQGEPHDLASDVRDDVYKRICDLFGVTRSVRRDVSKRTFGVEV